MTLHEAILEALIQFNESATTKQLADYINQTGIYVRGDKNALTASQIRARVNNYPQLFAIDANERISSVVNEENNIANSLPRAILNILRNTLAHSFTGAINLNLSICSLLIYFRKSDGKANFETFLLELNFSKNEIEEIEHAIQSIPINERKRIRDLIASANLFSISEQHYKLLFKNWLALHGTIKMNSGEFNTPAKINNIISSLLLKDKDYLKVLDPYAGTGSTLCFLNEILGPETHYDAQDINHQTTLLGKLNLIANGVRRFNYFQKDSIKSEFKRGYDLIVTTPPFGLKFELRSLDFKLVESLSLGTDGQRPIEYNVISQSINALNAAGRAIIVIPENFLFSTQRYAVDFRTDLVNKGLIEKIISLPIGAFYPYSSVKSSILVINKTIAGSPHEIEFIEISKDDYDVIPEYFAPQKVNLYDSSLVKAQEIVNQNGALEINRYRSWMNLPGGIDFNKDYVQLKTFATIITSFGNINRNYSVSNDGIPYIGVADLAKFDKAPFIDVAKVDRFVEDSVDTRNLYKSYFVPQNAVLVAKAGANLNPSVYSDDKPIVANQNIFCLVCDNKIVDPLFLATELRENYIKEQLALFRRGVTILSLRKIDFLETRVWLPSLEEQKNIANKRLSEVLSVSDIKRTIDNQNFTNEIIAVFKHEFGNLKNPLVTGIKNLEDFLKTKMDIDRERISQRPDSRNIKQVLDGLKHIGAEMGGIIDDMVDAIGLENRQVKTNVYGFFAELESKIHDGKCDITIENNISKKVNFMIDSKLLCKAFRNLVANAEKHGYDDNSQKKNILIKVRESSSRESILIDFINDGKSFKDGFTFNDYISFGKKSGSHSGSGIGGYLINKIIKDHDGIFEEVDIKASHSLETINNKDILKGIHFLITIPIYND